MPEANAVRADLAARFADTVRAAPAGARRRPDGWPALALPPALRETLVGAAALGACPPAAIDYYTARMPALLLEQLAGGDPARELLWQPLALDELPRLRSGLDGLFAALAAAGLDPLALLGAASPAALVAARPTVAALHAHALFGSGLPLLGAYPTERVRLGTDLATRAPAEVIDLRLSGNLVHELCHGPTVDSTDPPAPWMIAEAAALQLGATARPAHVFPDDDGEAVPGVSRFVLLGDGLARWFGTRALWSVLGGAPLEALGGRRVAGAWIVAGWQDWLARQEPPFARDALQAEAWLKLTDAARGGAPRGALAAALDEAESLEPAVAHTLPSLMGLAAATPWAELPWWHAAPEAADLALVARAVTALFQVDVFAAAFETRPSEPPHGRLRLDVAAAELSAEPRRDGVFGEPAAWIVPPPLCRRLAERGAVVVRIDGATRAHRQAIATALLDLAAGTRALPADVVLSFGERG